MNKIKQNILTLSGFTVYQAEIDNKTLKTKYAVLKVSCLGEPGFTRSVPGRPSKTDNKDSPEVRNHVYLQKSILGKAGGAPPGSEE